LCAGYETLQPGVYDDVLSFGEGNVGIFMYHRTVCKYDVWKWTIPV
jgi:hypothetical protein